MFALRSATASMVVRKIEDDLLFGLPRIIICDNGPQFQNLMVQYGVKIKYTAYYNPRANPTERFNRTLKTMLATYVGEDQRKWNVKLQSIACALRTASHEITRLSPYFVNFGRNMILHGDGYKVSHENVEGQSMVYREEKMKLSRG